MSMQLNKHFQLLIYCNKKLQDMERKGVETANEKATRTESNLNSSLQKYCQCRLIKKFESPECANIQNLFENNNKILFFRSQSTF